MNTSDNPWYVSSIQDFYYLKCPECTFDTKKEIVFQEHALQSHPLSVVFFESQFDDAYFGENYETNEPLELAEPSFQIKQEPDNDDFKKEIKHELSNYNEEHDIYASENCQTVTYIISYLVCVSVVSYSLLKIESNYTHIS